MGCLKGSRGGSIIGASHPMRHLHPPSASTPPSLISLDASTHFLVRPQLLTRI
jgi:hypothetical protein